jgi:hypothetical protein
LSEDWSAVRAALSPAAENEDGEEALDVEQRFRAGSE